MSAAPLAARIAELAGLLDGTAITSLSLSAGGETVVLRRHAGSGSMPAAASPPPAADGFAAVAPCPGRFLPGYPGRGEPLVAAGQVVSEGTVLGLLRAGPLLLPVLAPRSGTVLSTEAAENELVGFNRVLFRLAADPSEDAP